MNMSDDIAGAVVQVSTKSIEEAAHISTSTMEAIMKLLRFIAESRKERNIKTDVRNEEINDIKSGKVSTKELMEHCRKNHEKLVSSEHGITKDEVAIFASKAKKCGIPISFRNEKGHDNVYINLRESDVPIFKQLYTEVIKEKLQVRPQELRNYKCKEWEIPYLNAELKNHDLSVQFAKTTSGDFIAIYDAKDAKAIEIARSEFVRKANEVEKITFSKDDKGFYAVKDGLTGVEVPINDAPDKKYVSRELQRKFGYDKNKADIAAQKFGAEMLAGSEKQKYFSDDPISDFSYVSKVSWKDEDVMTKAYECFYVTPKEDGISRIVYQDNEGRFAVLNPPRQTKATMREIIAEQLGIKDISEQNALIAKAEHVSKVNAKYRSIMGNTEDIHIHEVSFTKEAFDMSNPEIASNMLRTDENGDTFTKKQPIDSISTAIKRKDMNTFEVKSTAISTEYDKNGTEHSVPRMQQLVLTFANKKSALEKLKELYKSQGVPEAAAKDMAKNVYQKAELQNAEMLISIEKKTSSAIVVSDTTKGVVLSAANREEAVKAIQDEYGISNDAATVIVDKAEEDNITFDDTIKVDTNINADTNVDTNINSEHKVDTNINGHEIHPEGNMLADASEKLADKSEKLADSVDKTTEKVDEIADNLDEVASRGGR